MRGCLQWLQRSILRKKHPRHLLASGARHSEARRNAVNVVKVPELLGAVSKAEEASP